MIVTVTATQWCIRMFIKARVIGESAKDRIHTSQIKLNKNAAAYYKSCGFLSSCNYTASEAHI